MIAHHREGELPEDTPRWVTTYLRRIEKPAKLKLRVRDQARISLHQQGAWTLRGELWSEACLANGLLVEDGALNIDDIAGSWEGRLWQYIEEAAARQRLLPPDADAPPGSSMLLQHQWHRVRTETFEALSFEVWRRTPYFWRSWPVADAEEVYAHVDNSCPHYGTSRDARGAMEAPEEFEWWGPGVLDGTDPLITPEPFSTRDVRRYSTLFQQSRLSPPAVILTWGRWKFAIQDGAHRLAAARLAGVRNIPAYIGERL